MKARNSIKELNLTKRLVRQVVLRNCFNLHHGSIAKVSGDVFCQSEDVCGLIAGSTRSDSLYRDRGIGANARLRALISFNDLVKATNFYENDRQADSRDASN